MVTHPGGQSLLKTKNEDQGFEIIKEVPAAMPRMGNPFFGGTTGLLTSPNLSSLAALMTGGSMSSMHSMSSFLSSRSERSRPEMSRRDYEEHEGMKYPCNQDTRM